MTKELEALLRKARSFLGAGESALEDDYPERVVSHAYYAMFHSARAMLQARRVKCTSHRETQGKFGLLFAKESVEYQKFHRYLMNGLARREIADYDAEPSAPITQVEASEALARAREFVDMAEEYLKSHPAEPTSN